MYTYQAQQIIEPAKSRRAKMLIGISAGILAAVFVIAGFVALIIYNNSTLEPVLTVAEMLELGEKYLLEHKYEQALVQFLNVIEIEERNYDAWVGLGKAYIGLEYYEEAEETLLEAISIDSERVEAYAGLGNLYLINERYQDIIDLISSIYERGIYNDDTIRIILIAYHFFGDAALERNDNLEAVELMDTALVYNRLDETTIRILLTALYRLRDMDRINYYQTATDPELMKVVDRLRPQTPNIAPLPGSYDTQTSVTLSSSGGYEIRFTANGDRPDYISVLYLDESITLPYGDTVIKAVSINECGLFSKPLEAVYTISLHDYVEIQFSDEAFGMLIRQSLGKEAEDIVYYHEIKDYEILHIAGNYIGAKNQHLSVNHEMFAGPPSGEYYNERGRIQQISDLALFPQLHTLVLEYQSITNLDGLSGCHNLKYLRMWGNELTDISGLGELNNLIELDFYQNQISDLSSLSRLINCKYMDLGGNQIVDITPLAGLKNLTHIWLDANHSLSDVSAFGAMSWLEEINLNGTQVTDVSMLSPDTVVLFY